MEQLKKENRRMDELITLKEDKIHKLELQLETLNRRAKAADEESARCKALEEKLKFVEK